MKKKQVAEREGFEPSMELLTPYSLSRGAPSADSAISPEEAAYSMTGLSISQPKI